jgi:hypothetical protein
MATLDWADISRFLHTAGGQVALLFAVLTVTYLLVIRFIRVAVPPPGSRLGWGDADEGDVADAEPEHDAETDDVVPEYYRPDVGGPVLARKEAAAAAYETSVHEEKAVLEALRVRGVRFGLGDSASLVMSAFPPGHGRAAPLIERGAGDRAWHVTRFYSVAGDPLTIQLERHSMDEPLRLSAIRLEPTA